jgi:hypothetical protein
VRCGLQGKDQVILCPSFHFNKEDPKHLWSVPWGPTILEAKVILGWFCVNTACGIET